MEQSSYKKKKRHRDKKRDSLTNIRLVHCSKESAWSTFTHKLWNNKTTSISRLTQAEQTVSALAGVRSGPTRPQPPATRHRGPTAPAVPLHLEHRQKKQVPTKRGQGRGRGGRGRGAGGREESGGRTGRTGGVRVEGRGVGSRE